MSDTDTPDTPSGDTPVEIEQTSNPADLMVPGEHLACGGVNFRRGICRDSYLGRKSCASCAPDEPVAEAKPAKPRAKRSP